MDKNEEELLVEQESFEAPEVYEAPALMAVDISTDAEYYIQCVAGCA